MKAWSRPDKRPDRPDPAKGNRRPGREEREAPGARIAAHRPRIHSLNVTGLRAGQEAESPIIRRCVSATETRPGATGCVAACSGVNPRSTPP